MVHFLKYGSFLRGAVFWYKDLCGENEVLLGNLQKYQSKSTKFSGAAERNTGVFVAAHQTPKSPLATTILAYSCHVGLFASHWHSVAALICISPDLTNESRPV